MLRLALDGIRHHWRMHAAATLGTALAAAILTGALLVGDSTDYSLRRFAVARLGAIHFAVEARGGHFSQGLADAFRERVAAPVVPALFLRGMALAVDTADRRQINQVAVIGATAAFWDFDPDIAPTLGPYETALNERLARALGVEVGDQVALRIAKPGILPRDAPLSSRAGDVSIRALCTVPAILPDSGLGRFGLRPSQTAPYNAFLDLEWLQDQVELEDRVSALLVGEGSDEGELEEALDASWRPEHAGLRLRAHPPDLVQLETDRIFLQRAVADAALALPGARGTLSYLVNSISKDGRSTPYSFATAGPVPPDLPDDRVVISRWLADALEAGPGDSVEVRYYELTPANAFVEQQRAFVVHAVAEMESLEVERALMPEFPGLTDVERCEDWDIGMPLDDELLEDEANEAYWNVYGPTPKLLCTLAAGQAMWANRFGDLMTVRFGGGPASEAAVLEAVQRSVAPAELGLLVVPVRRQAFEAVDKALDLGGLFLGMSFFLIVSAIILTALLFVFGVQQRASEMGTLLAVGFRPWHIRALFMAEAAAGAMLGAALGAASGAVYTRALIYMLTHYWQGAVAHTQILYHASPGAVSTGAASAFVCAMAAMLVAMWRQTRHAPRELLTMDFSQAATHAADGRPRPPALWPPLAGLLAAAVLIAWALAAGTADIAPFFFVAGGLLLAAGIGLFRCALGRMLAAESVDRLGFVSLAIGNAARRRGRSLSVTALLATGCFLVLAVSSMQKDVAANASSRSAGTGGFALYAETTLPLHEDPAQRLDLPGVRAVSLRLYDGDDASCLNLNRAQTPSLLGVNVETMAALGAFTSADGRNDLWSLLRLELPGGAVPALVGDADTALWGLQKKTGVQDGDILTYRDDHGNEVDLKLVGNLPMRLSLFQGAILISDEAFTRHFPSEDGFRVFLVDAPPEERDAAAAALNTAFDRSGMDAIPAVERLRRFYAVESTYLAMFLLLGGLGMVLGSAALGVVALRNLLERRREIAMLRAVGFARSGLLRLFLLEYALLLGAGLAVGVLAAAVAMLPAFVSSGSPVSPGFLAALLGAIALAGVACILLAVHLALGRENFAALRSE